MLRPLFIRMLGGTVHPVASHQVMPATLVPKTRAVTSLLASFVGRQSSLMTADLPESVIDSLLSLAQIGEVDAYR